MRRVSLAGALALLFAGTVLAQDQPKKITRAEALAAIATKVQPEYPPMAKQLHVEGEVQLEALVAENGTVTKVNILSGNPMLTGPTADTLKKWKFKPFSEDGKPIRVIAPLTFNFKL
ncbi:MAG TPA: energy transducer TonB [Bryobacteraceae bacterium]|nr:energy transducer TonB [Bryobacteraceae bacterium]